MNLGFWASQDILNSFYCQFDIIRNNWEGVVLSIYLVQNSLGPCLWGIALIGNWHERTLPNMGSVTCGQLSLDCIRRMAEHKAEGASELASFLHSSFPRLCLKFLLWIPAIMNGPGRSKMKQTFLPKLFGLLFLSQSQKAALNRAHWDLS